RRSGASDGHSKNGFRASRDTSGLRGIAGGIRDAGLPEGAAALAAFIAPATMNPDFRSPRERGHLARRVSGQDGRAPGDFGSLHGLQARKSQLQRQLSAAPEHIHFFQRRKGPEHLDGSHHGLIYGGGIGGEERRRGVR